MVVEDKVVMVEGLVGEAPVGKVEMEDREEMGSLMQEAMAVMAVVAVMAVREEKEVRAVTLH